MKESKWMSYMLMSEKKMKRKRKECAKNKNINYKQIIGNKKWRHNGVVNI